MASVPVAEVAKGKIGHGSLSDPSRAIGGPLFDAIFFWGVPLAASILVWAWVAGAMLMPAPLGQSAVTLLIYAVAVLTFARLVAVVPRAYLNRQVFEDNRRRLVFVPLLLLAGLLLSPTLLVVGSPQAGLREFGRPHSAASTAGSANKGVAPFSS